VARNDEDPDFPAASDDEAIQAFLDTKWREALRAAREGMEALREIWPEMVSHIPETGSNYVSKALNDLESAYGRLHEAGRHIIGQAGYDSYMEAQTQRRIDDGR
jgi:hypothetical protein